MHSQALDALLLPSTSISEPGAGDPVEAPSNYGSGVLLVVALECLGVAGGTTDFLTVFLESSLDGGVNWFTVGSALFTSAHVTFTETLVLARWADSIPRSGTPPGQALTAYATPGGIVNAVWGPVIRLRWEFSAGDSSGSYSLQSHFLCR